MTERKGILRPRPYARLLLLLGEQLIKNKTVALSELAKNGYDADASWVQIRAGNMQNFGEEDLQPEEEPYVEIEDDGDGMDFETIRLHWMNPGSDHKARKKLKERTKRKGRTIQGEKGIGRYACFKIGTCVELFTRVRFDSGELGPEIVLTADVSKMITREGEARSSQGQTRETNADEEGGNREIEFFDQIEMGYEILDEPRTMTTKARSSRLRTDLKAAGHGTLIRITCLQEPWTVAQCQKIAKDLNKLQSPFSSDDLEVSVFFDANDVVAAAVVPLVEAVKEADWEFLGVVDADGRCEGVLNDNEREDDLVAIAAADVRFRKQFEGERRPECGAFDFQFHVFDPDRIKKDKKLWPFIKEHRTYLYRDNIRVYPYGDPDDDWLELDISRGTSRLGRYISNDQLVGFVKISARENSLLVDKTNREGLIEKGMAYEDLKALVNSALNLVHGQMQRDRKLRRDKRKRDRISELSAHTSVMSTHMEKLARHLKKTDDEKGIGLAQKLAALLQKEFEIVTKQIELVQDLAGVGIAVDAASHDIVAVMARALETSSALRETLSSKEVNLAKANNLAVVLHRQCRFVHDLLTGVQPLFRSTRRKACPVDIRGLVEKVEGFYRTPLKENDIIITRTGDPIIEESSEGILLQILINLFDNAVYWLGVAKPDAPLIQVDTDPAERVMVFADNGPGVDPEDVAYIFDPFFTKKGPEGRGLGLYIARELAANYGYDLYYIENERPKIQSGANFALEFNPRTGETE